MSKQEELEKKIRASASLVERLADSKARIGKMCSDLRPPKMSIPVNWNDDDVFITVALQDAIAAQQSMHETSAIVCQDCKMRYGKDHDVMCPMPKPPSA